jgi:hypothetical protein
MNPDHTLTSYLFKIYSNTAFKSSLGLFHVVSSFQDSVQIPHIFHIYPMRATCPAHPIILNLIAPIILGDEFKLWRSLLRNFLHPPVTSSLLDRKILLTTLILVTLTSIRFLLKQTVDISSQLPTIQHSWSLCLLFYEILSLTSSA